MHRIAQEPMAFARLFCGWCAKQGVTPAQGAIALGYGPDIGNKWARGASTPPRTKITRLASDMAVPPPRLIAAVEASRLGRPRIRG